MKNMKTLFVSTMVASVILGFISYGETEGKTRLGDIKSDRYVVTQEVDPVFTEWTNGNEVVFNSDTNNFYVGGKSIAQLLREENRPDPVFEEIHVNGVKVAPQDKVVNITVPSTNGLAVASEVETTYAKKSEIPSVEGLASKQYVDDELTNYVKLAELQDGIKFETLEAKSFQIDGKDVSLVGHKHVASEITDLSESAQTAIAGINNATSMDEIKVALTNFLQNFVIHNP